MRGTESDTGKWTRSERNKICARCSKSTLQTVVQYIRAGTNSMQHGTCRAAANADQHWTLLIMSTPRQIWCIFPGLDGKTYVPKSHQNKMLSCQFSNSERRKRCPVSPRELAKVPECCLVRRMKKKILDPLENSVHVRVRWCLDTAWTAKAQWLTINKCENRYLS